MSSGTKKEETYTRSQVREIADADSSKTIFIIDNVVYDVSEWKSLHPGGASVLEEQSGRDATLFFTEVGHSGMARKRMTRFRIGVLCKSDTVRSTREELSALAAEEGNGGDGGMGS